MASPISCTEVRCYDHLVHVHRSLYLLEYFFLLQIHELNPTVMVSTDSHNPFSGRVKNDLFNQTFMFVIAFKHMEFFSGRNVEQLDTASRSKMIDIANLPNSTNSQLRAIG